MKVMEKITIPGNWREFLTLPQETILLVKRKHWFALVESIILIVFFVILAIPVFSLFHLLHGSLFVTALSFVTIFLIAFVLVIQSITGWFFHLYIVTNRRLAEVYFYPLAAYAFNDVLLDQVRCTEIDVQMHGIISELFDIGSIVITFDRPTHDPEFTFWKIQHAKETGRYLNSCLFSPNTSGQKKQYRWYRDPKNQHTLRFTEEIYSQKTE
jgi:hypothetical protein